MILLLEEETSQAIGEALSEQFSEQIEAGQEALRETTGMFSELWQKFIAFTPTLIIAVIVFLLGMLLSRIITGIMKRAMKTTKMNAAARSFGQSFVRIVLYTAVILICLSILGVSSASIVAIIGTAGVTVGLALQNSLSNLAGGFVIMFAKPFRAGDYIICSGQEGFVESVSILYTALRTRDNRIVYLPNSIVSSGAVVNLSRLGKLKLSIPISVSYSADIRHVRTVLLETVSQHGTVLKKPKPTVTVSELADSSVNLSLNVWVNGEDYFAARPAILECAKLALDDAGIEIPFPQVDVHYDLPEEELDIPEENEP